MKKFFLLLAIISTITQAQAFEDYIILGDKKFDFIKSQNNDIVSVEPFYTIDNTKNIILLKSKQIGKTQLIYSIEGVEGDIEVEISEDRTILSKVEGLSYFVLDLPEKSILHPLKGGK